MGVTGLRKEGRSESIILSASFGTPFGASLKVPKCIYCDSCSWVDRELSVVPLVSVSYSR